jgi:hypothetical protein
MGKMTKRSHSKVAKLPEEIRAAVDRKIMEGVEYQEIADYINSMGTPVSRSSVNRYGQKFMAKMERLRLAREQAKIVVEGAKDGPALETVEAANQMAVQIILERLIEMDDIKEAKSTDVLKALALLERSATNRERLKLEAKRKADEAIKNIESAATAGRRNLDPDTLAFIKEQIYGITST